MKTQNPNCFKGSLITTSLGNNTPWASLGPQLVKNMPANAGDIRDVGLIPGSGRSPGGRHGNPFQSFVWRIPWIEEPGGL